MPDGFASQYASAAHRDDSAESGMWVFISTEVLLFGALILSYFVYRHVDPAAFAAASGRTDIVIGAANTAILLTSSFLIASAVEAAEAERHRIGAALVVGAIALGAAFLALKSVEYAKEYREHLVPGIDFSFDATHAGGAELFFVFYFVATGIHALHMLVGIGILAALATLFARQPTRRHRTALRCAALYWHFVDIVWIFLFALIYLPGRSS